MSRSPQALPSAARGAVAVAVVVVVVALFGLAACSSAAPESNEPVAVLSPGKEEVSLLFVGDTSVARAISRLINGEEGEPARGPAFPFAQITDELQAHDLVFANLECVLSDSTEQEAPKTYRIRAEKKNASALHESGIDVVSVANNHTMDFGLQGMNATLQTLKDEGVVAVGAQREKGWKQPVTIVQVGVFRVGFLAYNAMGDEYAHPRWRPTPARYEIDDVLKDIERARPRVDFLVVSVHGGIELSHELAPWQEADARAAVDAGADLWIGHHPHVVQPFTVYKGKVIAWSLGDFVFDKEPSWLIARNDPRLFLQMKLKRQADGAVVADHAFFAGGQDPKTWQPRLAPGSFDVDSFEHKVRRETLRDRLPDAKIERVRGDVVTLCDRWDEKRIRLSFHAFRWLYPRFACDDEDSEKLRPWETIAASAELFEGKLKHGIWAHPHANGVLRLRFPDVELGSRLEGFAGFTDWQMTLRDKAKKRGAATPEPAKIVVTIADPQPLGDAPVLRRLQAWRGDGAIVDVRPVRHGVYGIDDVGWRTSGDVPCEPGTTPLQLDTTALRGQRHDVVVEISGGSGDVEGRFLFDLGVVP